MLSQTVFSTAAIPAAGHHNPETLAVMAEANVGSIDFYPTDAIIYAQGDKAGPLYLVEFGTVRICRMTADGRRQINAFHFAGDVFGLEGASERQCYAESVDGVGLRTLRPMPGDGFANKLLGLALRGLAQVQQHLLLLGRMNANEKVATFLLDLLNRQGSDTKIALQMQRNDIADYLGLTFETVSRVFRVLKDRGIIRLNSVDRVEVLDRDALGELCF